MRLFLGMLICLSLAAPSFAANGTELVTVKNYGDLIKLQTQELPPIPAWLIERFKADPGLKSAVPLPDGRWVVEEVVFETTWDDLKNVYVSGFPVETAPAALQELFADAGGVERVSISRSIEVDSGKTHDNLSATVRMKSFPEAQAAESKLMGQTWQGSKLYVKAKTEEWVKQGHLDWNLFDVGGNQLPKPNNATGTGWEDRVWPNGFYRTIERSGLTEYKEQDHFGQNIPLANRTHSGGYYFLFDIDRDDRPLLAVYDHATGELISAQIGPNGITLPTLPYRYCYEIERDRLLRVATQQLTSQLE